MSNETAAVKPKTRDSLNSKVTQLVKTLILLEVINENSASKWEREPSVASLVSSLVKAKQITDQDVGKVVAQQYNLPYANLAQIILPDHCAKLLSYEDCQRMQVCVFACDDQAIKAATTQEPTPELISELTQLLNREPELYYTTPQQLKDALRYRDSLTIKADIAQLTESLTNNLDNNLAAVGELFNLVVLFAYKRSASDIHIEPQSDEIRIRMRVDGVLHHVVNFTESVYEAFLNHLKVITHLRTDEHKHAQEGRFELEIDDDPIDFRVTILPTFHGEKVVLRLLTNSMQEATIFDLGYSDAAAKIIAQNAAKPHGMILCTGPTGSGKTTTLYALLKYINKASINIATIEDPVEYSVEGINQVQVNEKAGVTFTSGLKSILRQDPDAIMVGEIRDEQTAKIATGAALTGHIVLATLHANSATLTPVRLRQMGLETYLIGSTLNLIIAQRLVRKVCPHCINSYSLTKSEQTKIQEKFGITAGTLNKLLDRDAETNSEPIRLYRGKGCEHCNGTGYLGRTVIAELLPVDEKIRQAIASGANSSTLKELALAADYPTMVVDGVAKALQGVTTLEEVLFMVNN